MVGKPNLPPDADDRDDLKGSATEEPGLTPMDQEREASMADEGGASGATIEREDRPRHPQPPKRTGRRKARRSEKA